MKQSLHIVMLGDFVTPGIAFLLAEATKRSLLNRWPVSAQNITMTPTSAARNAAVREFLASGSDWIFMVDSDQVPPVYLLDLLDVPGFAGRDIVSPPTKIFNRVQCDGVLENVVSPHWQPLTDEPASGPWLRLAKCGAGCMFVRRRVFEQVQPPWFHFGLYPDGSLAVGEDFYFCQKAREAGFHVWGYSDARFEVGHFKYMNLSQISSSLQSIPDDSPAKPDRPGYTCPTGDLRYREVEPEISIARNTA